MTPMYIIQNLPYVRLTADRYINIKTGTILNICEYYYL